MQTLEALVPGTLLRGPPSQQPNRRPQRQSCASTRSTLAPHAHNQHTTPGPTNNSLASLSAGSRATQNHTPRDGLLYLSHLVPRSFSQHKRREVLDIFKNHTPYVPMVLTTPTFQSAMMQYYARHGYLSYSGAIAPFGFPLGPNGQGWPKDRIPVEVIETIAQCLPHDTMQNMRLVNHEFEKKVSRVAFETVVVPFRPEIYGMMVHDSKNDKKHDPKGKGKAKATDSDDEDNELYSVGGYYKIKAKDVYDGMKVFEAWGSHIKQFGMTFEINAGKHGHSSAVLLIVTTITLYNKISSRLK